MYVITDETTHTSITDGAQYWAIPKSGTTTLVRDGYLYVYNPSFDRLEFPRALISTPATNSDAELADAISFMTAPQSGGGGGTVTGAESGVYLNTGKVRLGGALLENVELSGTFNVAFLNKSVSIGTNAPSASAALQVNSTTKGVLLPRMTKAQREAIASPATGLFVYQTDDKEKGLWVWNGDNWMAISRQVQEEHFLHATTGEVVQFNSNTAGGGVVALAGTLAVQSEAATASRQRFGVVSVATAVNAVSRATIYTTGFYTLTNGGNDDLGAFYWEWENGESVAYDNTVDSAYRIVGLLTGPTGSLVSCIGIRPPYTTESQTYKNVIMQGGLENAGAHFDSGIPYNTGLIRYKKHGILWDGVNLHFINSSETDVQIRSIANFGSTFPSLATITWQFGIHTNRAILSAAAPQRSITADVVRRWVYQVPYKYRFNG